MGCVNGKGQSKVNGKSNNSTEKKGARFDRLDCRMKSLQTSDKILQNVTVSSQKLDEESHSLAKATIESQYLFHQLSAEEKEKLISELIQVSGMKDQYVFKQGEKGSCFFIIKEGRVAVEINGEQVKTLQTGEMFGELALIYCATRSASIKCLQTKTTFLAMKSYVFKKTMRQTNLKNAAKLQNIVNRVKIFSYLTNKQKRIIANNLVRQPFKEGACIFKVDEPANSFYIIEKGSVRISIPGKEDIIIKEEDSFGENSFYQGGQRSGSAFANEENTILISIGRQQIENCLGQSISGLIHHNVKKWALTRSDLFSSYDGQELDLIAESFQVKISKGGNQLLMPKHKHPTSFIICMEGQINGQPPGTMFCHQYYGKKENTLLEDVLKTNKGAYATLEFKALAKMNQTIKADRNGLGKRNSSELKGSQSASITESKKMKAMAIQKAKNQFQSMEMLQKLGEGQFGEVYLVRNTNHGNVLYAIKCINIQEIKKERIEECLISERKILASVTFPAIVGFVQAYKDKQYVYFLMQFINGVEMFDILREIGLVNNAIASFYIGTLMLSIQYLHNQGIIYRDIKPENSVVGHDGKVFLIDLGTAKHLNEKNSFRTFTIIGTPHYMAPQVFQGKGYSFQADYWSLGVMLYQFFCGNLPYGNNASDPYGIFAEIMSRPLKFPSFFKDIDAEQVIKCLLSKNSAERSVNNGFAGIKKMTFFSNIQWDSIVTNPRPPYIPKKFRNVKADSYHKNQKGEPFLDKFYKAMNIKNRSKKPLQAENAELEIWDSDSL